MTYFPEQDDRAGDPSTSPTNGAVVEVPNITFIDPILLEQQTNALKAKTRNLAIQIRVPTGIARVWDPLFENFKRKHDEYSNYIAPAGKSEADENAIAVPAEVRRKSWAIHYACELVTRVLTLEQTDQLKNFVVKHNFAQPMSDFLDLYSFQASGTCLIHRHGVSAMDIIKPAKNNPAQLGAYLRYLVDISNAKSDEIIFKQLIQENLSTLVAPYEEVLKVDLRHLGNRIISILDIDTEDIAALRKRSQGVNKRVFDKVIDIITRIEELRTEFYKCLLNPEREGAEDVRNALGDYFDNTKNLIQDAMLMAGVDSAQRAQRLYRQAQVLSAANRSYAPFYQKLVEHIIRNANQFSEDSTLTTADALEDIRQEETSPVSKIIDMSTQDIARGFNKVARIKRKDFTLAPDQIKTAWRIFTPPQSIQIHIEQSRRINIRLHYENTKTEEQFDIVFYVSLTGNNAVVDWSLLDSLSALPQYAQPSYRLIATIFDAISVEEVSPKLVETVVYTAPPHEKQKRIRLPRDVAYELRRERKDDESPRSPIDEVLFQRPSADMEEIVKLKIAIPMGNELALLLVDVPPDEHRAIRERIESFNVRPNPYDHDLHRIKAADGRYSLRSGNWRILLALEQGELKIIDIRNRRDTYSGKY